MKITIDDVLAALLGLGIFVLILAKLSVGA